MTSSPDARFVRLRWQRRLRAARPVLVGLAVLGFVAFAGWVFFFSSWLTAQQVDVRGTTTLSDDQVLAAADVAVGTPLIRVDLDDVRDRVAAIPAVAAVSVHRRWPHTVTISVSERVPAATLRRGDGWYAMDKAGVVFGRAAQRDATLPVLELDAAADSAARREVGSVLSALPPAIMESTRRIRARSMDSISLLMTNRRQVVWGSAGASARKVAVLEVLLAQHARVYDVSVPEQPSTRR